MKKILVISVFLVFYGKIGFSQLSGNLDFLVTKFINDFETKVEFQIVKKFSTPTDSCESVDKDKIICFYRPAVYYAVGYQPQKYFISITCWPDKTASVAIMLYNKPGFDFIQLSCYFEDDEVKNVGIMEIPEGSDFHYRYFVHKTYLFSRLKVWSEKNRWTNDGYTKESEGNIAYSTFVNRLKDLSN